MVLEGLLDQPRRFILSFPNARWTHNFQLLSRRELLLKFNIHLILQLKSLHEPHVIFTHNTNTRGTGVANCSPFEFFSPTFLKSSDSSTWPRTCFTRAWRISRQWILFPLAMGRLKLTRATVFGFGIPRGGSRLAIKSDSCWKRMNCVAWGSYLKKAIE